MMTTTMKDYSNPWICMLDADHNRYSLPELSHARKIDEECARPCTCGGKYWYRIDWGCLQCTSCGVVEAPTPAPVVTAVRTKKRNMNGNRRKR